MKILLVEDHEEIWDFLSRRLRRRDHEVLVATDGAQGVRVALTALPDIVLLDMNLPVMDGWAAVGLLKATPTTANIPVVALTAHAMSGDEHRTREAGCDAYVSKPIDFEELLAVIDRLAGGAAAARAA